MTDELRDQRLAAFQSALDELMREGVVANINDWRKKAKVGWSTINDFLIGETQVMSDRTYIKLANAVSVSDDWLKGKGPRHTKSTTANQRFERVVGRLTEGQKDAVAEMLERMFPQEQGAQER